MAPKMIQAVATPLLRNNGSSDVGKDSQHLSQGENLMLLLPIHLMPQVFEPLRAYP